MFVLGTEIGVSLVILWIIHLRQAPIEHQSHSSMTVKSTKYSREVIVLLTGDQVTLRMEGFVSARLRIPVDLLKFAGWCCLEGQTKI